MYNWTTLLYTWSKHNIVNQLNFNKNCKKKNQPKPLLYFPCRCSIRRYRHSHTSARASLKAASVIKGQSRSDVWCVDRAFCTRSWLASLSCSSPSPNHRDSSQCPENHQLRNIDDFRVSVSLRSLKAGHIFSTSENSKRQPTAMLPSPLSPQDYNPVG